MSAYRLAMRWLEKDDGHEYWLAYCSDDWITFTSAYVCFTFFLLVIHAEGLAND